MPEAIEVHGHRGCRGLLPENTIPAFLKATELGAHALELDVVITGDAQVLVSHEPWFAAEYCLKPDGTTIAPADELQHNIYKLPYQTIKQYDCGSKTHPRFPKQQNQVAHKPLLSEVIEAVQAYCAQQTIACPYFNIEIKSTIAGDKIFHPRPELFVELLLEVLANYKLTEQSLIQSFDVRPLQVLHHLKPTIKLGLLTEDNTPPEQRLDQLGFMPYAYNPNYSLIDGSLMQLLQKERIKCFAWTVNDAETVLKMLNAGVDGIISDYPDMVLREVKSYYMANKTS
ncbi:glycerophosphodiester phosphodiesterase [Pontibacter sp. Tf4]|uniref:glycerophosphodiester phosphodiesterase family protein n=1 Tax=Pontibacter sp. Tf4 TaxID=2761620 RepID=UPI0016261876|nr:glycerophosphodiester phosphodiesterase family protein [Pontibacter sp. Tf4]MBB6609560.1 glycerophosphodiester phosphodiesterase [Pontibacter sp. Tf4]